MEALLSELDSAVDHRQQHSTTMHVNSPVSQRPQLSNEGDFDEDPSLRKASTATKELDDLMASLSDFKVNAAVSPPANVRNSGDYAKPEKGKAPASGEAFYVAYFST